MLSLVLSHLMIEYTRLHSNLSCSLRVTKTLSQYQLHIPNGTPYNYQRVILNHSINKQVLNTSFRCHISLLICSKSKHISSIMFFSSHFSDCTILLLWLPSINGQPQTSWAILRPPFATSSIRTSAYIEEYGLLRTKNIFAQTSMFDLLAKEKLVWLNFL